MKIVFLDVDGVLNHEAHFMNVKKKKAADPDLFETDNEWKKAWYFDPECVARVNKLSHHTRAKVVISSSWRFNQINLDDMIDFFTYVGIENVIDRTPQLRFTETTINGREYNYSVPRGCEIKAWLEMNKDLLGKKMSQAKYVILDDDSDMLYWQRNKFVHINDGLGFNFHFYKQAIEILEK